MKMPFDIKYRPQIESGEYKVVDKDGRNVRIICWDMKSPKKYGYHLVGLIEFGPNHEESTYYTLDGKWRLKDKEPYLFLIKPEEELTEFENTFGRAMMEVPEPEKKEEWYQFLKEKAAELLSLAREQFIKDGYVIEKKAFHDAVENISDKHLAEMSVEYSIHCKVENGTRHAIMNWEAFQKVAQKFIDIGKAEALNDLPRWKKIGRGNNYSSETKFTINGRYLEMNDLLNDVYEVSLSKLEKLLKDD